MEADNIGSGIFLPVTRQAITWTKADLSIFNPSGTNFSDILIDIQTFSFQKCHLQNGINFVLSAMC